MYSRHNFRWQHLHISIVSPSRLSLTQFLDGGGRPMCQEPGLWLIRDGSGGRPRMRRRVDPINLSFVGVGEGKT